MIAFSFERTMTQKREEKKQKLYIVCKKKFSTEHRENGVTYIQYDTHIEYKIIYALNLNLFFLLYAETSPHKAYYCLFCTKVLIGLVTYSIV